MIAVMLYHVGLNSYGTVPVLQWGAYGVDLFFVLSGFLITGILLRTRIEADYFRNFYIRRILRIWPLYFACFALALVLMPATVRPVLSFVFFVQNLYWPLVGPLQVTWSLAVEEQFYLLWPLIVRVCSVKLLGRIAVTVLFVEPLVRMSLVLQRSGIGLFHHSLTRLDPIAAGCLIALVSHEGQPKSQRWGVVLLITGVALFAVCVRYNLFVLTYSAVMAICSGVVLLAVMQAFTIRNRFLVFTGNISYGLYMLHFFVLDLLGHVGRWGKGEAFAIYALVGLPLTYAAALVSWRWVESPANRLKSHFENRPSNATQSLAEAASGVTSS